MATITVADVGDPKAIWNRHSAAGAITAATFDSYMSGATNAIALEVTDVLPAGRSLGQVLEQWKDFRPPQSFRYLTVLEAKAFGHNV